MSSDRSERRRIALFYVYEREGGRCFYCDGQVHIREGRPGKRPRKSNATFDHIIPRSDGGKRSLWNGVCACFWCNNKRGNMPADQFLVMMYEGR